MIEAVSTSEMLVYFKATYYCNPESHPSSSYSLLREPEISLNCDTDFNVLHFMYIVINSFPKVMKYVQ
jgi:hypothetical protein